MTLIKTLIVSVLISMFSFFGYSQKIITDQQAIQTALDNNFSIKRSENTVAISKNNTSKYNTGQLPTISMDGGANARLDNSKVGFQDGRTVEATFAGTQTLNASMGVAYTIFDGYARRYNIEQLQEQFQLSKIQVETAMQTIAAQTLAQYYQVATLQISTDILREAIEISQQRLVRAQTQVDFGQGSQLQVLNAQVDLNNDSLNLQNAMLSLENAKRELNNIMVADSEIDYEVIDEVSFIQDLSKEILKKDMLKQNLNLAQMDQNIRIGELNINLAESRKLPTLGANVSYGFNYSNNNETSLVAYSNSNGLNAGLTLRWNIFDGGTTKTAIANAKLNAIDIAYQKDQLLIDLETDFDIAWATYQNKLLVYQTNQKNLILNQANFKRTEEQFKVGQINSVDFRTAQLNLLNAENNLNNSEFQIKIAEVQLMLLSGNIMR